MPRHIYVNNSRDVKAAWITLHSFLYSSSNTKSNEKTYTEATDWIYFCDSAKIILDSGISWYVLNSSKIKIQDNIIMKKLLVFEDSKGGKLTNSVFGSHYFFFLKHKLSIYVEVWQLSTFVSKIVKLWKLNELYVLRIFIY